MKKYIEDTSQKRIYMDSARSFKLWANYIAGLLLDREANMSGETEKWFEPKDIKTKLKNLMPFTMIGKGLRRAAFLRQMSRLARSTIWASHALRIKLALAYTDSLASRCNSLSRVSNTA